MGPLDWAATAGGGLVVAMVLLDVILTVLHPDHEGRIARRVQRLTWVAARALSRRIERRRRSLLAAVGATGIVATAMVWGGMYIGGFALIYWPHLEDGFIADPAFGELTLLDAVYFSGVTATVLGYGDIVGDSGALKVLSFAQSGLGFALVTGVVTYLLSVLQGLGDRNQLALHVADEAGETGRGRCLVTRWLDEEMPEDLAGRLDATSRSIRVVHDRLHRFPVLALYYRSRDPHQDIEWTIEALGEAVLAGYLVSRGSRSRARPAVERMDAALTGLLRMLGAQYASASLRAQLADPAPDDRDVRHVDALREALGPDGGEALTGPDRDRALIVAARSRLAGDMLEQIVR